MFLLTSLCIAKTLYFIRHGEKPEQGPALNEQGVERAFCVAKVFGPNGQFTSPKKLVAQPALTEGKSTRPVDTLRPLAADLKLPIYALCPRDNITCAGLEMLQGDEDPVIMSWEHKVLTQIMAQFINTEPPKYPGDRFDLVYKVDSEKGTLQQFTQNCSGFNVSEPMDPSLPLLPKTPSIVPRLILGNGGKA